MNLLQYTVIFLKLNIKRDYSANQLFVNSQTHGVLRYFIAFSLNVYFFQRNFHYYLEPQSQYCRGLSRRKIKSVSDISQNSILEKRTLHKIQYQKNGLFTIFNSVHVHVFRRASHLPPIFLEIKNVPCSCLEVKNKLFPFLEVKSKLCPFSTISRARKSDSCQKSRNAI